LADWESGLYGEIQSAWQFRPASDFQGRSSWGGRDIRFGRFDGNLTLASPEPGGIG